MKLNAHEFAIIEQALREAINQGADYHKIATYQAVLGKLQETLSQDTFTYKSHLTAIEGFRYDYDDNVELL
jgi:hypothetical protein